MEQKNGQRVCWKLYLKNKQVKGEMQKFGEMAGDALSHLPKKAKGEIFHLQKPLRYLLPKEPESVGARFNYVSHLLKKGLFWMFICALNKVQMGFGRFYGPIWVKILVFSPRKLKKKLVWKSKHSNTLNLKPIYFSKPNITPPKPKSKPTHKTQLLILHKTNIL